MNSDNPLQSVMEKVGDKQGGMYFEVGMIQVYNPLNHTAIVKIPTMNLITDPLRISTPRVGTRFNAREGQECLVVFPSGDPMDSEARVIPFFYGADKPPQPDLTKVPLCGMEQFVHETPSGSRDECYDWARRLLYGFIELGALATFGVLLGEPCAAAYHAHVHIGLFGVPVLPTLPLFYWFPASHISQTVKVQP